METVTYEGISNHAKEVRQKVFADEQGFHNKIGIFAVSTSNTDYILVKGENFDKALNVLASAGYDIV